MGCCLVDFGGLDDVAGSKVVRVSAASCLIEGCGGENLRRGWCTMHYVRWYRHGDPLYVRPTYEERFWGKVAIMDDHSCWEWRAYKHKKDGYGRFGTGKGERLAHRIAYRLLVGDIPDDMELDHICRNRGCVNPNHLEPVPHAENMQRATKDHCKRGHKYTLEDTFQSNGKPRRNCRICKSIMRRRRYLQHKGLAT